MAPALDITLVGQEMAACAALGAALGGARALFPEKGRAAFLPDVLLVGALLLGLLCTLALSAVITVADTETARTDLMIGMQYETTGLDLDAAPGLLVGLVKLHQNFPLDAWAWGPAAAGLAALDETVYVDRVRALLAQQRPRLTAGLRALKKSEKRPSSRSAA